MNEEEGLQIEFSLLKNGFLPATIGTTLMEEYSDSVRTGGTPFMQYLEKHLNEIVSNG